MPSAIEFVKEHKVPIAVGVGGLVLFFVLRKQSGPTVAAAAPVEGQPTGSVSAPAMQGDYSNSQGQVSQLQQQMQQQQFSEQVAASNLALQGEQQQLAYQGQAQQQALGQQAELNAQQVYANSQQAILLHEQVRSAQGSNTPWYQWVANFFGAAAGAYKTYQGLPGVQSAPRQSQQAVGNFVAAAPQTGSELLPGQNPAAVTNYGARF